MYQQDDRDIRAERAEQKLEPRHAMLLRCRLGTWRVPAAGGVVSDHARQCGVVILF